MHGRDLRACARGFAQTIGEHSAALFPPSLPPSASPSCFDQTVVVIGGSAGIGLETARRAREEGARWSCRAVARSASSARTGGSCAKSTEAFLDAADAHASRGLRGPARGPIDHLMLAGGGPYGVAREMDFVEMRTGSPTTWCALRGRGGTPPAGCGPAHPARRQLDGREQIRSAVGRVSDPQTSPPSRCTS